jgi:plastocyanin
VNHIGGAVRIRGMRQRLLPLLFILLLTAGLAACGSSSKDSTDSNAGTPTTTASGGNTTDAGITIASFQFTTKPVKAGSTVTVANNDTTAHSVVSDEAGLFETAENVEPGGTQTITAPDKAGSYPFHCGIHSTMTATLTVE